jgi:hypothetical protein
MIDHELEYRFNALLEAASDEDEEIEELTEEVLEDVSGGYPCSYLGVYDYTRMQSYASRNYSC